MPGHPEDQRSRVRRVRSSGATSTLKKAHISASLGTAERRQAAQAVSVECAPQRGPRASGTGCLQGMVSPLPQGQQTQLHSSEESLDTGVWNNLDFLIDFSRRHTHYSWYFCGAVKAWMKGCVWTRGRSRTVRFSPHAGEWRTLRCFDFVPFPTPLCPGSYPHPPLQATTPFSIPRAPTTTSPLLSLTPAYLTHTSKEQPSPRSPPQHQLPNSSFSTFHGDVASCHRNEGAAGSKREKATSFLEEESQGQLIGGRRRGKHL